MLAPAAISDSPAFMSGRNVMKPNTKAMIMRLQARTVFSEVVTVVESLRHFPLCDRTA